MGSEHMSIKSAEVETTMVDDPPRSGSAAQRFSMPRRAGGLLRIGPGEFAWLGTSLLLAVLSMLVGTDIVYVGLQAAIFCLMPVAWRVLYPISPITCLVIALTLGKNFLVSQPIKLLLLQPADGNLAAPVATAGAILFALIGAIAAGLIWRALPLHRGMHGMPGLGAPPPHPRRLAYTLFAVGIISRVVAITQHSRNVVFVYLSLLVFAGVVALVLETRSKDPRRVFDWRSIAMLATYAVLGLAQAGRTEILVPFVFALSLYVYFRVRIPTLAIVLAVLGAPLLLGVISPAIDYARSIAPSSAVGSVFVAELGQILIDPHEISAINDHESLSSEHMAQIGRQYFGSPMGLLDRFTPNQVDNLVAVSEYQYMDMGYIYSGILSVLPQTFGAQREANVGQKELESFKSRATTLGGNMANYGLIGTLALCRGYPAVFIGFIVITFLYIFAGAIMFGGSPSPWALIFLPAWMFVLADGNWASVLITAIHGSIIAGGGLLILTLANVGISLRAARRRTPAHLPIPGGANVGGRRLAAAPLPRQD